MSNYAAPKLLDWWQMHQYDALLLFFPRWTSWCWPEWWSSPSPRPGGGPSCWPPAPQKRPTSKWGRDHREAPCALSSQPSQQANRPLSRHTSNNKAAGTFYIGFVIETRLIYQSRRTRKFERMASRLFKACSSFGRRFMLENISLLERHTEYSRAKFLMPLFKWAIF